MKKIFLLLISIILVGCGTGGNSTTNTTLNPGNPAGTLEDYQLDMTYRADTLAQYLSDQICLPDTTDQDCANNNANLESEYGFTVRQVESITDKVLGYSVSYSTKGVLGENRHVSGEVLIPNLAVEKIKGVLLFYHGTSITKSGVPSCVSGDDGDLPSYCRTTSFTSEFLSSIMASQGYIVVMPDYVGQGIDEEAIHPYILYPQNNAMSGINMLIAARSLLTKLNFPNNKVNLFVSGFSEGGAYSLWATKLLQTSESNILNNNNFDLKLTVGLSGAYDLVNAQMPMELDNISADGQNQYNVLNNFTATIGKPALTAYFLTAYGFYDFNQTYSSLLVNSFFNCISCKISGRSHNLADLFTDPELTQENIGGFITAAAAFAGYGKDGNNSIKSLITEDLANNQAFKQRLVNASITTFRSTTLISLVALKKDSVVTNLNLANAYNGIHALSPDMVNFEYVDNLRYHYYDTVAKDEVAVDHIQAFPILLINALSKFNKIQ